LTALPQGFIVGLMTSWQQKIPMWITMSRILMVPVVLLGMSMPGLGWRIFAALIFILASVSDYFDGYYARKYNAVSNMGKFMDPIADKILVTSVLVALIPSQLIDHWMVIIILARDTLIGGLRSVAAADQVIIAAKPAGKWKTAMQMVAIPAMIIGEDFAGIPVVKIGFWVLWLSVILSLTSGIEYVWGYYKARPPALKT
jgi:CDP-diacylglycerol--glycerol-3-phosphate 3-phosphatidyltransferase